jgi:Methyltransferase domain
MRWSSEAFDEGYYGGGARGGFTEYNYDSESQRNQLATKFSQIAIAGIPYRSILFIGCAKGFEVKFWVARGYDAWGVDVSEYAIKSSEPEVKDRLRLYDGSDLSCFRDGQFDIVAFFDVMALVPEEMREKFIAETLRVARHAVIFRSHVVNHREPLQDNGFHGLDGAWFKYWTFEKFVEAYEKTGLSKLQGVTIDSRCEAMFYFRKSGEADAPLLFRNFNLEGKSGDPVRVIAPVPLPDS